jgi:hypothetical protein
MVPETEALFSLVLMGVLKAKNIFPHIVALIKNKTQQQKKAKQI